MEQENEKQFFVNCVGQICCHFCVCFVNTTATETEQTVHKNFASTVKGFNCVEIEFKIFEWMTLCVNGLIGHVFLITQQLSMTHQEGK